MDANRATEIDTIPPHLRVLLTADEKRLRERRQLITGLTVFLGLLAALIAVAAVATPTDPVAGNAATLIEVTPVVWTS